MLKTILIPLVLPLLMLFSNGSDNSIALFKQNTPPSPESETGTLEKMMVADGSITMDIDLPRLNGIGSTSQMNSLRFAVAPNSFFTILVFNKDLRGPDPGSMALIPQSPAVLPAALGASSNQLYGSYTKKWISDECKMIMAETDDAGVEVCLVKKITRKHVGATQTAGRSYQNGRVTRP